MKTADDIIDKLDEKYGEDNYSISDVVNFTMKEYASQFKSKWIDLSVSKPDPNSLVLVAIKHPNGKYTVETCHFTKNGYFGTFYNEEWFTHYMPLPEPPKED